MVVLLSLFREAVSTLQPPAPAQTAVAAGRLYKPLKRGLVRGLLVRADGSHSLVEVDQGSTLTHSLSDTGFASITKLLLDTVALPATAPRLLKLHDQLHTASPGAWNPLAALIMSIKDDYPEDYDDDDTPWNLGFIPILSAHFLHTDITG